MDTIATPFLSSEWIRGHVQSELRVASNPESVPGRGGDASQGSFQTCHTVLVCFGKVVPASGAGILQTGAYCRSLGELGRPARVATLVMITLECELGGDQRPLQREQRALSRARVLLDAPKYALDAC